MTIQTTRREARYKDFYINFDVHPVRGDLFVLTDEESIKRSIKNLIFTDPGERMFSPFLGSGIRASLFENITFNTAANIKAQIEATIENFEPRALLIDVYVTPDEDRNGYNATIVFSTINNPQPVTFDVLLTRVR